MLTFVAAKLSVAVHHITKSSESILHTTEEQVENLQTPHVRKKTGQEGVT
jgi:hypothetical protein